MSSKIGWHDPLADAWRRARDTDVNYFAAAARK